MGLVAVLALWLSLTPLLASPVGPFCALSLAFLSSSSTPPLEVIRDTYRKLWYEVGGGRAGVVDLTAVFSGQDPFTVPTAEKSELQVLRKRLGELHQMLKDKEWDTREVREALLDDVKKMAAAYDEQAARLNPILQRAGIMTQTYAMADNRVSLSPDGRYLMAEPLTEGKNLRLIFQDRQTKTDHEVVIPNHGHYVTNATFTPDGKRVIVMDATGPALRVFPFAEGKLDLKKEIRVSAAPLALRYLPALDKRGSSPGELAHFSADGNTVVVSYPIGGLRYFVFDLKRRNGRALPVPGLAEMPSVTHWGFVPGTNQLYLSVDKRDAADRTQATMSLEVLELAKNKLTPLKTIPLDAGRNGHDRGYRKFAWTRNGKFALMTTRFGDDFKDGLDLVDIEKGTTQTIDRGPYNGKHMVAFVPHPNGKLMGVVLRRELMNPKHILAWYDVEKKAWDGEQDIAVSLADYTFITPDGYEILTNTGQATMMSTPVLRD